MDAPKDYIGNYTQDFAETLGRPKRYVWPAIASWFVPGLGQWLKSEQSKGWMFFIAASIIGLLIALMDTPLIVVLLYAVLNLYGVYDAYTNTPIPKHRAV